MNDYSDRNASSNSILSLEVAVSRFGVADRATVDAITKVMLAALGLVVVYVVLGRQDVNRGASCALVSIYSTLFIYHRTYDLPILILPLLYAASRFRSDRGPARACYLWIVIVVLAVINTPIALIQRIDRLPAHWAAVKALIVPLPIYLIASAMIAQLIAVRLDRDNRAVEERVDALTETAAVH